MIYGRTKSLEDSIIEILLVSPRSIKDLHQDLLPLRSSLSLRAVYKAVDHLLDARVILKAGKQVRINEEWAREVQERLSTRTPFSLEPGEKVSRVFNSIENLDTFWKTISFGLEREEQDAQVFFYNPHNFWAYIPERKESEHLYYKHFSESKIHAFFTVGGAATADKEFKRAHQDAYLQIDTRLLASIPRTDHITILGDYVITVRLSKKLAARIDELYAAERPIAEILPDLLKTAYAPSKIRFVIEHDPHKAKKLRKQLSLNFYFRKQE